MYIDITLCISGQNVARNLFAFEPATLLIAQCVALNWFNFVLHGPQMSRHTNCDPANI